jgi:hypothetical protein
VYSEAICPRARRAEVFAERMGGNSAVGRQALETIFSSVSDIQELEHCGLEHWAAVRPAETW